MKKKYLIILFLLFVTTSLNLSLHAQDIVTYKVFQIKKSTDNKKWENISFVSCMIVHDIVKLQLTIYKGDKKLIYSGYDVEIPKDDPKIGTTFTMKSLDNLGSECIVQQINWNGNLLGTSTFLIHYQGLHYSYDADLIKPNITK